MIDKRTDSLDRQTDGHRNDSNNMAS